LPRASPAGQPAAPAKLDASAAQGEATAPDPVPVGVAALPRRKPNCAGCGVIESMRKVDRREQIMEGCAAGDASAANMPYALIAEGGRDNSLALADVVDGVIFGDRGAKKVSVTTRYQMVVRFRDGSKHVFNEETPRTMRVGDRIQVIAALAAASS
jgi:outer membrane lipoprotein SlyB